MNEFRPTTYNPDVLTCIANLSNDEVFTPPNVANAMLDLLPQELFCDPNTTFLDPMCKSGVFLREIAKRLIVGLEDRIPDLQERIDHIFHKQLFGIAITELTSLLSRRSVYCAKYPNSRYSVSRFEDVQGNIRFKNTQHVWKKERCAFCGASEKEYKRDEGLETHAYEFIHTVHPEEIYKMKFDVIIGNPPYQLDTGGGQEQKKSARQAKPIYHLFVEKAKKLNPRYLTMIIPARWYAGGMGMDQFRETMLKDKRIATIVDYANAKDCFPSNSISGGVCFFLWDRDNKHNNCEVVNINGNDSETMDRMLDEFPVLVRYNKAVGIVRKVRGKEKSFIMDSVSSISPFGLNTKTRGEREEKGKTYRLFSSEGISYIGKNEVVKGHEYIGKYKVMISQTGAEHAGEPGKDGKYRVLTKTMGVLQPDDVCTHSYLVMGPYKTEEESINAYEYLKTKFSRFLILQAMTSIHLSKSTFVFVPEQKFNARWTDEELYKKYDLTEDEISFIESMIRTMEDDI